MIETVMKAISGFVQRILPNSETALYKLKRKEAKRKNREYIKNQYRRIFAEANIIELNLIQKLIDNNNTPIRTIEEIPTWEVSHKEVVEHFFQIIDEIPVSHVDSVFGSECNIEYTIRITVTIFENVKKEFNKYGKVRIPNGFGENNE